MKVRKEAMLMYLEDVVGNVYREWKGGESVFISAPTGVGKTTFVLNQLVPEAKRRGKEVLFLSNRTILRDQIKSIVAKRQEIPNDTEFLRNVEEFDGITLMSYQKLQAMQEKKSLSQYIEQYLYVVFDEIHYMLEDSLFNPKIYYIQKFIENCSAVKVFLSATMREAQEYILTNLLDDKRFDYTRKEKVTNNICKELMNTRGYVAGIYSYIWYVDFPKQKRKMQVKYFDKFEQIAARINRNKEKWLVFIGNKGKAGEWTKKIERPYEVVSAETKETEIVDGIIQNEKFETDVLVTTKLLDNGVNFKDSALKNIVLDTISEVEFMQMIGRKRLQEGEEITVYIPKKEKKFFVGYDNLYFMKLQRILEGDLQRKTFIQEVLDVPETYEIVRKFFVHLYVKEDYDSEEKGVLKLNEAGKYKVEHLHAFVKRMEEAMEEDAYAFVKEQLKWLGQESDFSEENDLLYEDRQNEFVNLQNYLQEVKDVELDKDQQNVFREKLTLYIVLLENELKSGRTVGKNIITKFFEKQGLPYYIEVKKAAKKGDMSKWIIRRQDHGLAG